MIAKILVDIKAKNVDKTYDYLIPPQYQEILEIGARVIVPFGNRSVMGFCLEIAQTSEYHDALKEIQAIIDLESYLTPELIDLGKAIQSDTSTMLIKVLEAMLPAALKVIYRPKLQLITADSLPDSLQELFEYSDEILLEQVNPALYPTIKQEIQNQHIKQIYDIKSRNRSLSFKYVELTKKEPENLSEKQMSVITYLLGKKSHQEKIKKTCSDLNITDSVVKTLEKHRFVKTYYKEQYRKIESIYKQEKKDIVLNEEQEKAYQRIMETLGSNHIFLLHGVTGSGKTEIYIKTIQEVRKHNQSVIYLVPEISLTPMMMSRLKAEFGNDVAVLHSGLSILEKYDEWRRIIRGEAQIIVGARSACFAPLNNIGLIVVDECHESTYKQDQTPNYYALDVLMQRAKNQSCVMIMGSATPNIETYARQAKGYYELLTLERRAMNAKLPQVEIVDMKQEFIQGNTTMFSQKLHDAIQSRLDRKEQVILLLNRRGHSNFVICRNCGHVIMCPNCDISLTYHEYSNSLKCHYCSHDEVVPKKCPVCQSEELRFMGSGTQKVENELHEMFPLARIIRMDNDTTRKKNAHEKLLHEFEFSGDILLGTQMIAKGLDFPKVTLVGMIQTDSNLYVSDFRAPEKTFQLIMQVSGRSGRRETEGEVIIQAFNPDHYAIKFASQNDYSGFYHHEMNIRRLAKYSPYYFMIELKVLGSSMRDVFYNGVEIVKYMKRQLDSNTIVLGPSIPVVKRINNRYHVDIMIKYREIRQINEVLHEVMDQFQLQDNYIIIDRFPDVG